MTYSDTFFVDAKDGFAHIFVSITFKKFLTEPDLKTLVVLGFQFITLLADTVHTFEMTFSPFSFDVFYFTFLLHASLFTKWNEKRLELRIRTRLNSKQRGKLSVKKEKNIFVELLIDIIFNAQRIFKVFPEISII